MLTYRLTRAFEGVFDLIKTLEAGNAGVLANESNEEQRLFPAGIKNSQKAPSKLICQHALGLSLTIIVDECAFQLVIQQGTCYTYSFILESNNKVVLR